MPLEPVQTVQAAQCRGALEVELLGEDPAGPATGTAAICAHPLGAPSVEWVLASTPNLVPRREFPYHRDSRGSSALLNRLRPAAKTHAQ